ncbi:hypothetical protein AB4Z22_27975, partial [Paenibacillus sp. TAF58]
TSSTMKLDNNQVDIQVSLNPDANLRNVVDRIHKDGASIIGKRTVNIDVKSNPSEKLDQWWSKALFEVAQAMETKHYADIPTTLQKYAEGVPTMKVDSEMDQTYLRI